MTDSPEFKAASERADRDIAEARAINRTILVVVALIVALLVGWNWPRPADAAPVKERLDYSVGENPRDIGDWSAGTIIVDRTWAHKRWPVAKVVKQLRAKGVPVQVGRCWDVDRKKAPRCVTVSSDRYSDTGPTGKRLGEVSLWSTNGQLDAADISLDDRDGKKASAKKRERKLRSYILQAAGR